MALTLLAKSVAAAFWMSAPFPVYLLYVSLRYLEVVDIFSLTLACSIVMPIMTAAVRGS